MSNNHSDNKSVPNTTVPNKTAPKVRVRTKIKSGGPVLQHGVRVR